MFLSSKELLFVGLIVATLTGPLVVVPNHIKAVNCETITGNVTVSIVNNVFVPAPIHTKVCSEISITNYDSVEHKPATGTHPGHEEYPELSATKPLKYGESFSAEIEKAGTFTLHDHLNEDIATELIVEE